MSHRSIQDYEERQKNELLSISAIFPDQVKEIKSVPLEMEILVLPAESMPCSKEDNARVTLYIKCMVTYPDSSPFIDLKNCKGLSKQNLALLKADLIKKAKELLGKEVIWELVHHIRYFLYDHKEYDRGSFYDAMVFNNLQKQKEEEDKIEKMKKELERQEKQKLLAIEQETLRKKEALRDAHKKTRFSDETPLLSPLRTNPESVLRQRSRSTSSSKETCSENNILKDCKDMINLKLKFLGKEEFNVTCGRCFKHGERGCIIYQSLDSDSGKMVAVIKWTLYFNVSHKLKGEEWEALQKTQGNYIKQIQSIEQEFKTLRQLNFPHLLHYLGMSYISKKEKITIYVLQEFISGASLLEIFRDTPITIPQLQHYTRQILEALQYLHKNCIVHKSIRLSNVYVDSKGSIRVGDYSLDKRLYDLSRMVTKEDEIDVYPPTIGKGGQKSDIYRLGVVLLTLFAGPLDKEPPIILPDYLNPTFKDFLSKCFIHDEQERWSAEQLLSHTFLSYQVGNLTLPRENEIEDDEIDDSLESVLKDEVKGSRLTTEFEILKTLGKGGFGHVWKVKNKLDSRLYALKRIPVNPFNKQLNRKIKREVKLLSRLNHENIVRYYNSWIEAAPDAKCSLQNGRKSESDFEVVHKTSLNPTSSSIQWNIHDKDFSSYEEDCDDEDDFVVFLNESNLEGKSGPTMLTSDSDETPDQQSNLKQSPNRIRQYMYIQMEFCEKSTLRTAIDNGLHKDVSLVWRLFREIVEGLHYIHLQKVIHRDLKPVNIFLDLNDHVKIGDFGLATDVISKAAAIDIVSELEAEERSEAYISQTGRIGTAFYVAPELNCAGKVHYNQKVDIYSLGIIFFEMCFPPPNTLMERNIILSDLRKKEIILPDKTSDFLSDEMIQIILWLLQHDVTKRPSSMELLTSKYIPPLLMEESELNNLLQNTISNPQSRLYKHMINSLFNQEMSAEFEFTYDTDIHRGQNMRNKPSQVFSKVVDVLNKIMRVHAAVYFSVPTLMPKNEIIECDNCVSLVEHGGDIVMLPRDLRIPFARYISRSDIQHLKRYSLEKVYRQQKVYGCHPIEQFEFAFDIITPTPNSFLPDAEIIATLSQIISEFSSIAERKYYIRINHPLLLAAVMTYAEIEDSTSLEIVRIAAKHKSKTITKALLTDENNIDLLGLSERSVSRLCQYVELEDDIHKISDALRSITMQKKSKASLFAERSLKELDNIISLTEALHVELPIVICPGLIHNVGLFSGMFFHCISQQKSKRKNISDIIAAGGRYDKLIHSFKLRSQDSVKTINQSAVGVSIAIETIVTSEFSSGDLQDSGVADFLIHSEGSGLSTEKASLMKEIQDLNFRATVLCDKNLTFDDAADFCRNHGIPHILILSKEEQNVIKVRTLDRERLNEKRIFRSEIKDSLTKLCFRSCQDSKVDISRSSSLTHSSSNSVSVNVRFLPSDKTHNNKKREQYIRTHVMNSLQISSSHVWELIPVDIKMSVVGTIVSYCDINATIEDIQRSFDTIIDEHAKYKRYLSQLCEEICDIKKKNSISTIILFSLPDNNFRVIL